jgi:hypothetical protein
MALTKGPIQREGVVRFHDAQMSIWEDPKGQTPIRDEWEKKFKRDVFLRIAQQLRRLGWECTTPPIDPRDVKHYGGNVARWAAERHRNCSKGDLQGELSVSGRCIEFKMWQDVQNIDNPNGGKYDFDKAERMTYVQRLEMERTRRRIRDYLCNVFTGYEFEPERHPKMGLLGLTAEEKAAHDRRTSGHYRPELDRAQISMPSNARAADGGTIEHGSKVWALDRKGRVIVGTAYYDLNSSWQVVTGRYGLERVSAHEIFTKRPDNLRMKRNGRARRKRLEGELNKAVEKMNFERAATLRDILFPGAPKLFVVWHAEHKLFHCADFCGYTADKSKAGKFTADEVRNWNSAPNVVMPLDATKEAA